MPRVAILTEAQLRACVALDLEAVDVVERGFAALAAGGVIMPPVLSMAIAERHGEVDVKTAYVPGLDGFAIKVSPGFFDNPKRGLPSLNGLMVLLDAETGIVKAVLLDNGYLTDLRTAAAGAVAARHLAPRRVTTAGVIGAGVQAELQVRALKLVRDFESLMVWARDPAKAQAYAERMEKALARPVRVAADPEQLVRASADRDHDDAGARAARPCRVASSRLAHHGDGLRCRRQERTRAANRRARRPVRLRPQEPVGDARRDAGRHCRRCRRRRSRRWMSSGRSAPGRSPAAATTTRSRSAI